MISDLKPFRGGNDLLWALNRLSSVDKHANIIPIACAKYGTAYSLIMKLEAGDVIQVGYWQPLDKEAALLTYPPGREFYGDIQLAIDVAFRDINLFESQPVITILCQLSDLASRIIGIFEERFFK